ncbi:MAG: hypothetical protein ABIK66_06735 [candidate division WOR-3 bacterium]
MRAGYFIRKGELLEIGKTRKYVGINEFQLFGLCSPTVAGEWVFFTNDYIYSVPQEVTGGSVDWEAKDMIDRAINFRPKIKAHMSVHRHLAPSRFSGIDRGENGVLSRFRKAKNLYQIDLVIYTNDIETKISDLEIYWWDNDGKKIQLDGYYFILDDTNNSSNNSSSNEELELDIDLESGKKVITPRTIISLYETNYPIKNKINKNLLIFMSQFITYKSATFDIRKSDFKIKYPVYNFTFWDWVRNRGRWWMDER